MTNGKWKMTNGKCFLADLPRQTFHDNHQLSYVHWLRNVCVVTSRDCAYSVLRTRVSGERDCRHVLASFTFLLAHLFDQFITICIRHADIADQKIELLRMQQREGLASRAGSTHPGSMRSKVDRDQIKRIEFVLDDQNAHGFEVDLRHIFFEWSWRRHALDNMPIAGNRKFDSEDRS